MECWYCGINAGLGAWKTNSGGVECFSCGSEYRGPETESEIAELRNRLDNLKKRVLTKSQKQALRLLLED